MTLSWLNGHRATLARSGVLRQALRVELIEQSLADDQIPLPDEQQQQALLRDFWQRQTLPPEKQASWLRQRHLSEAELIAMLSRPQRWRQWCSQRWAHSQEALLLKHKNQLDQASIALLRLEDEGLARELYLQLQEGEATVQELAERYCRDQPQRQAGQWGHRPLIELPPALADMVRSSPPGKLREPVQLAAGDWVILRVERFEAASLNDPVVPPRLYQLEGDAQLEAWMEAWLNQSGN